MKTFRALHDGPNAFVIPNPWDRGSAVMLHQMGFQALATTSAGMAFAHGWREGEPPRAALRAQVFTPIWMPQRRPCARSPKRVWRDVR